MGMLTVEMKKGVKVRVEGHMETGDLTSPYVNSIGYIEETPLLLSTHVLVRLEDGPSHKNEVCSVPVGVVYWTQQDSHPKKESHLHLKHRKKG